MGLSLPEIQEYLDTTDLSRFPAYRITVLRNITVETIEPYLRYSASQAGLRAEIRFGEFDQVMQESLSPTGLLTHETDCVLIFTYPPALSPVLSSEYNGLSADQNKQERTRLQSYISTTLSGIRNQTNALILWHTFETPTHPALGLLDSQSADGQTAFFEQLNASLREALRQQTNAYAVDLNLPLLRLGEERYYDLRYWHLAKAPYSREALRDIALEDLRYIRASRGLQKKCLVLDCDDVLWGGIIGEDGLDGIKLGRSASGSPYFEFQQEVLNLYHRGVILALCSKNNEKDVWEVFQKHPQMVLREKHIAASQINWDDKVTNLRRLADQLNIGLESLVLFDDSEFEANLIRQTMPEITVVTLPKEAPHLYRRLLASSGLFESLIVSAEDSRRGTMYREESERKSLAATFRDLDAYLKSLDMEVRVAAADTFSIPRIAQLTQKTNQFNLTTRRYTEEGIRELVESRQSDVLYLHLKDRFGDSGIVGVAILEYKNDMAILGSLLLSCRVLGRRVEDVFLSCCLKQAQDHGAMRVVGLYRPTAKNGQVRDFYEKHGFQTLTSAEKDEFKFERLLQGFHYESSTLFKEIDFNSPQAHKKAVAH